MNVKQFLVYKINEKLPSEILDIIWESVKDTASKKIASIYFSKVAINRDIFLRLLDVSDYCLMVSGEHGTADQLYTLEEYWSVQGFWGWPEDQMIDRVHGEKWAIDIKDDAKILIAKYINYIASNNKITYSYIQEPGTWLTMLRTIREIFFISPHPSWQPEDSFWVNLKYIMDKVKNHNTRFIETGVMWWEY